ncbi:hypothetical protein QJQ45_010343 [Haematococcus lacustris]|nr:hypothetical protein QJQ45_010343 [Haematococcus lacustris]
MPVWYIHGRHDVLATPRFAEQLAARFGAPCVYVDGPSGSGQQEDERQGQGEQEVIAERRQVIKAAFRALVEAARPDLSPAQVDAVVAQVNQRMTMGQRIGESKQRPLELCSWKDLQALPPIGKEYQQRYKLVNDRLPKVRQRLHRAAEYRRGIDGRARNNA